jgi:hypothetical protein
MLCAVAIAAALATPLAGQLPNPGAAALGMGDNYTALARGSNAISSNPAGLAMPDGPSASGSIFAVRGVAGLGPIGLGDLADFEGESVPDEVRQQWLDQIVSAGGERGSASAEVTYLAAQAGRFGVQVATAAHLAGDIAAGAAELLLFGNAGRTGEAVDIALDGSSFDVVVASTAGFSYAHPIVRERERSLSLGATIKYTVGHLMVTAVDLGSETTADPLGIQVEFPIVETDTRSSLAGGERGSGVGLDLGVAWREGRFLAGLVVKNVVNSFAWNEETLNYRAGRVSVTGSSRVTDFEEQEFASAPDGARMRVRDLEYPPVVAAGLAYEFHSDFRLSADLRQRIGEGEPSEAATHLGVGAEYRPLRWLPARAGTAVTADGFLLSGGIGLDLAPVRLDAAAARRWTDRGPASLAMFSFSIVSR